MNDSWKTPEIRAIEKRFHAALHAAERSAAETRQLVEQKKTSQKTRDELKSQFEKYARSPDAPKPVRELHRKITRGDFTWDDVFAGRAGTAELREAAQSQLPQLEQIRERLEAGEHPKDISGEWSEGSRRNQSQDSWRERAAVSGKGGKDWTGPYGKGAPRRRDASP